jgi:hypothetical protein
MKTPARRPIAAMPTGPAKAEPKVKAFPRLTVVETLTFQAEQAPAVVAATRTSRVTAGVDALALTVKAGPNWVPLPIPPGVDVGTVVVVNTEGTVPPAVNPTPDELAERDRRVVDVGLLVAAGTGNKPDVVTDFALIRPKDSFRVSTQAPGRLRVRCEKGGGATVRVYMFPA